jgi:hypothetical protein
MTSIIHLQSREQYNKTNSIDENTSDESLLMADSFEDRAPLLNIIDDDLIRETSTDIPLQPHSSPTHCHASNETIDNTARNRLIIVLILCIIFMIIEIIGTFEVHLRDFCLFVIESFV